MLKNTLYAIGAIFIIAGIVFQIWSPASVISNNPQSFAFEADIEKRNLKLYRELKSFSIVDSNLYSCVKKELDKYIKIHPSSSGGKKSATELIIRLTCNNYNIESIDGISNIKNLGYIDLSRNHLDDVSELNLLNELKFLELRDAQIENENSLFEITELDRIYLPDLFEVYCAEIENWIKENGTKVYNPPRQNCLGGGTIERDAKKILYKIERGKNTSLEEDEILEEYQMNESIKRSYEEDEEYEEY